MATVKGTSVIFGCDGSTATLTGLASFSLLQSSEFAPDADKNEVMDSGGNVKTVVFSNFRSALSGELIIDGATTDSDTLTVTSFPTTGSLVTITDAEFTPAAGTWIVDSPGPRVTRTNNAPARATFNLIRYDSNSLPS